jgi:hypothetical protein
MSGGKSGSSGSSTTIPTLSPEQNAMIAAQTGLYTGTVGPAYQQAVTGATNLYNNTAAGVTNAAQNLAGTAAQAQNVLGSTGESALKTGISGLENIDSTGYEQQQLQAALQPAQAQYAQNIANQSAQFGGAGQLGSARSGLAQAQSANMAQAAQMNAAAGVESNIANQRLAAGQSLIGAGQAGLGGAQAAAQNQVNAAMQPQALYNQYANVLFGTPSQSWNPNFAGTQATTTNQNKQSTDLGFNLSGSDIRLKEKIVYVGNYKEHKLYEFNYKNRPERYRGVMAQDVEKYMPDAIVKDLDGMLLVNYAKLGLDMIQIKE